MSYKETCTPQAHTLTRDIHDEQFQVLAPHWPHSQACPSKCCSQHTCTVELHTVRSADATARRFAPTLAQLFTHAPQAPTETVRTCDISSWDQSLHRRTQTQSGKVWCVCAKRLGCKLLYECLGALCVSVPNGSVTSASRIAVDVWKAAHTLHCVSVVASWWVWLALEGLQRRRTLYAWQLPFSADLPNMTVHALGEIFEKSHCQALPSGLTARRRSWRTRPCPSPRQR